MRCVRDAPETARRSSRLVRGLLAVVSIGAMGACSEERAGTGAAATHEAQAGGAEERAQPTPEVTFDEGPLGAEEPRVATVRAGGEDGTESNGRFSPHGLDESVNVIGWWRGDLHRLLLRFPIDAVAGERFVHARLVLPAALPQGSATPLRLQITGLALDGVPRLDRVALDDVPRTSAVVGWDVPRAWPGQTPTERERCMAVRRYSPDISPIINELLARPFWGSGGGASEGAGTGGTTVGLVVELSGELSGPAGEERFVTVEDGSSRSGKCRSDQSAALELYPSLRSTFLGTELLGRITDTSVTVNVHALVPVDVAIVYGKAGEGPPSALTEVAGGEGGEAIEIVVGDLSPDTAYEYQLAFRARGGTTFMRGPTRSFHTQRPPGSAFVFAVQSDSHLQGLLRLADDDGLALYRNSLDEVGRARPDFLIDLGDTFHTQFFAGRDAKDLDEAVHRHLDHRALFDRVAHSVPLLLVVGNHEGEQGWRLDGTRDNLAVWATEARKRLYPNPVAGDFYDAPAIDDPWVGDRESMFAFTWGDALFVAIDPYWFTPVNPHAQRPRRPAPWMWTLGEAQYRWLRRTLEESRARYKLVFAHHVTGGLEPSNPYGRGGARAARHALGGQGSFEWGGENRDGSWGFDEHRPGWGKPIHQVMVDAGVNVFFHGHDHCFAYEVVDGIAYQAVPTPSDSLRGWGQCNRPQLYAGAVLRRNSGHLRVSVAPERIRVEYVRSSSQEPAQASMIAHGYEVADCGGAVVVKTDEERGAGATGAGGGSAGALAAICGR